MALFMDVHTIEGGVSAADVAGAERVERDPHLAAGLNVRAGRITHPAVAASLGFDGSPVVAAKVAE